MSRPGDDDLFSIDYANTVHQIELLGIYVSQYQKALSKLYDSMWRARQAYLDGESYYCTVVHEDVLEMMYVYLDEFVTTKYRVRILPSVKYHNAKFVEVYFD